MVQYTALTKCSFVKELPVKPLGLSLRVVGGIWYNVLNGLVVQSWLFALDFAH